MIWSTATVTAQFGNEWINFDQDYYKIPVAKNGLYRLTYEQLRAAGMPTASVDPRKFQLFHRGVEQAIIVQGEGDGVFHSSDVVEFYGTRNDGTLDTELYEQPAYQPHRYYNLFSDTTSYFLTIGTANGKRMEVVDDDVTTLPSVDYHMNEIVVLQTTNYSVGVDYGEFYKNVFDKGEGWMSGLIRSDRPATVYEIAGIAEKFTNGPKPKLELVVIGRAAKVHQVEVSVGSSRRLVSTVAVDGFSPVKVSADLEWADLGSDKLEVSVKVSGNATRVSIGYLKLVYPQRTDVSATDQYYFWIPSSTADQRLDVPNLPAGCRFFDVTDNNAAKLLAGPNTSTGAPVLSSTAETKILAAVNVQTTSIHKVRFDSIVPEQYDYIIISHPYLRRPAASYGDPVLAYAEYRSSDAGGGYRPLVVNIADLYNQFSYGEQTPLAIFRFMKFLSSRQLPDFLFLIGKGLDVNYNYHRNPGQYKRYPSLIPPSGWPASDIAFSAGLGGSTFEPGVATGRIASSTAEEVAAYLDKVKESEALPFDDLRRKHVLHLSGGLRPGEPQSFRRNLEAYVPIAEQGYLGGKVAAMAKQSTDITLINIAEELNKGLNLVTFFGHSSPGSLDFDIGFVTDPVHGYANKGKYPVMLMNGCDAGAFFLDAQIFGENWVNARDKGAIAFIAHSSFGFVNQLREYSRQFYSVGYADSVFVRKTLGQIQKESCRRFLEQTSSSVINVSHVQQISILGDPAIHLFGAANPDFSVQDENLSILSLDEEPVTALSDSFALRFVVRNFGLARKQNLKIEVKRTLNDRSTLTYDSIYPAVKYSDTLLFVIKSGGDKSNGFGNNTFSVRVDADDEVEELREDNNIAYLDYFIPANATRNLFPKNYGIVTTPDVVLSFQHSDILSGEREYVVEVDTTKSFNSPFKKSITLTATVLARQPVALLDQDTTVYHWRTKLKAPLPNESKDWVTTSFTFIRGGSPGWTQVDFDQLIENTLNGFVTDAVRQNLNFVETRTPVDIITYGSQAGQDSDQVSVRIKGNEYHVTNICRNNTINLIAFNRVSTVPYVAVTFETIPMLGRGCGSNPVVINSFLSNELLTGNGDDVVAYVDNVSVGDSVILFSIGDPQVAAWPDEVVEKLAQLGISSSQLQDVVPGEPFIIFARKGAVQGSAVVKKSTSGSSAEATLEVNASVTGRRASGEVTSRLIGPAGKWNQIIAKTGEQEATDYTNVDVVGVNANGTETLIFADVATPFDLSVVDATSYPFLRLKYSTSDDINLTATQLDHWFVLFEPVAEGLILYNGSSEPTNLFEGETWQGSYSFINVSDEDFSEDLTVDLRVFNQSTVQSFLSTIEIAPPAAGDTTNFTIDVPTLGKQGLNDIEVFVNPGIEAEEYYENNAFVLRDFLLVEGEHFNPVVDVTVDGRYLERDEFVSANPSIDIRVWDENPYLLISDTTQVTLFLSKPCGEEECPFERISFSNQTVQWFPATDSTDFRVHFKPEDLPEGTYVLRVEAKDHTGNPSGVAPYEISFVVKHEVTLVVSPAYPNPVKDELRFDVTLSGREPHADFEVHLIDIRGQFLLSLTPKDFGPLHIGRNTISWNIAHGLIQPGVYVYKVITRDAAGIPEEKVGRVIVLK